MSTNMTDSPDATQWSNLFMLVGVVAEQHYIPLHEDALSVYSDVKDVTDAMKLEKSHNSRKRALSVGCGSEHSIKRAKNLAGEVAVTSVSKVPVNLKLDKESDMVAKTNGAVSALGLRPSKPLPVQIQGITESATSIPDIDVSWIPQSYRNRSKIPDTRMHKLFLSQCSYLLPEYHENGGIKKRNEYEREAFLNADEWVEVRGGYEVRCQGCKSDIALDPREGRYYANLWVKHRSGCPGVYKAWLERNGWSLDSDREWFRRKKVVQQNSRSVAETLRT
ncbi:hypothetical protein EDD18DRAFT_1356919 [Armillaria luteobubalina]|uniref:Uncharacterized protein n=1 Tax=Armillaria luteobubalina TaxID=153913 RepID=A0AA39UKU1_9AGAR|nr:hypothetical protein EDD18DRAFT_1356919 [Armillaria luteobubalina]